MILALNNIYKSVSLLYLQKMFSKGTKHLIFCDFKHKIIHVTWLLVHTVNMYAIN